MKYKNYRNSYTNDNRIYSFNDIYDMPLGEVLKRKQELLSQYRVLGVPKENELRGSDNVVYVHAYTRDDGTEVKAHYRSKPEGAGVNDTVNYTEYNNITNQDKDAETQINRQTNANAETNYQEQNQENNKKTEPPTQEKDKLYPDEIAGVKRGEPMTFEEADGGKVNPNYESTTYDKDGNKYYNNCQCCVIAYEARRRGYDVEAGPYIADGITGELGKKTIFGAWINTDTGEVCEIGTEIDVIGGQDCYNELENVVKQGERYALVDAYFVERKDEDKRVDAHVRVLERDNDGNLIIYDPQDGGIRKGNVMKEYINKWMGADAQLNPQYLRIDNKAFNPYYLNDAVKSKK